MLLDRGNGLSVCVCMSGSKETTQQPLAIIQAIKNDKRGQGEVDRLGHWWWPGDGDEVVPHTQIANPGRRQGWVWARERDYWFHFAHVDFDILLLPPSKYIKDAFAVYLWIQRSPGATSSHKLSIVQWYQISSLGLALVRIFTPWKWVNAILQGRFPTPLWRIGC